MRPIHLLISISFVTFIAACEAIVIESTDSSISSSSGANSTVIESESSASDSSSASSSVSSSGQSSEEPDASIPEEKPDADVCESFYCEWPVNECAGLESAICMSDQTWRVYQCQQVQKDGCPEWVHVGDYVDGGVVIFDGG